MIIAQLSGGFGNQLFQYAAAISLAAHHKVPYKVDASLLLKPDIITGTVRTNELTKLSTQLNEAEKEEVAKFFNLSLPEKLSEKVLPFYKRLVYKEKSNKFDPKFFLAGPYTYIRGNRQSEQYFKRYETTIRSCFSISKKYRERVDDLASTIRNEQSISVHIRRGDYQTQIAQDWLGILPKSYYYLAISEFASKILKAKFYIFTDDVDWVEENLPMDHDHEIVSDNLSQNSIEDFYLMSQCRHNIIANSTFSWWAAWLNGHPDKIVIAPKQWYQKKGMDTSDLIPESWIRM